jgi:tRNA/tmRNA/rRNA uracil-C5-methylase (TrmA/RlmC/RlmD family)
MKTPRSKPKITKAIPQTITDADPMASLKRKLKSCDLEVQNYVAALEAKNFKLTRQIAKFQVEFVTINNMVKSLIEQNEKDKGTALIEAMSRVGEQLRNAYPKEAFYGNDDKE